ncbi:transposase [Spiroplasma endosymbiont of Labia minor]|uniref:transposase n=1 Tax=Spiroplasma endosymbiont of Labia minor TaxID=3066305 RepID=UPI003BAF5A23
MHRTKYNKLLKEKLVHSIVEDGSTYREASEKYKVPIPTIFSWVKEYKDSMEY